MQRNIDITALDTMKSDEIAALPVEILADLQDDTGNALALAKKRVAMLNDALDRRYSNIAQEWRRRCGKETGIVRISDGDCSVVAETKKAVTWDQDKLAELYARIRSEGDDPEVYIVSQTVMKVREVAYSTWPADVKAAFEPARTVKVGSPSYRIERGEAA